MDRKKAVELSVLLLSVASQVSTFDKERFDEAVNTFKEKISNIAVQLIDELS